ncbi:hypothetical protein OEZ85_013117 [Tetradesmus obliquus]|uniref:Legumain prodomain domain-containing protein n=1 Tax=Tetradesmus obliquus TaxID=3088 RepID=A0ABY8U9V7_TETOB|nr:hypothetical protein OEZ85_013117 [Tetradesmus obliquus]
MAKLCLVVTLLMLGLASCPCLAGRLSSDQDVAGAVGADVVAPNHKDSLGKPAAEDTGAPEKCPADFADGDDPTVCSHWALLVAGSSGWGNYRHQADVFHAYQVLINGGYSPDHIVVMAYDDIAHNPENPMPGKVFNAPGGPDVYSGVRIDYKGEQVNAVNFLNVLEGNSAALANKGSGRVIASGPRDKVFLFYSDHGAAGVLGMPSGPFLYADELMASIRRKFQSHGFKEMVMYIEACESGSMFEGLLDSNMAAYVTTAANAYESSWATYCPEFFGTAAAAAAGANVPSNSLPAAAAAAEEASSDSSSSSSGSWLQMLIDGLRYAQRLVIPFSIPAQQLPAASAPQDDLQQQQQQMAGSPPAPQFYTCLGDLYSVAWMEDAEASDLTHETLLQQYKSIKRRTSQNFTYEQGSHVMQYGALDIDKELAGDYQGMMHNGSVPPTPSFPSAAWIEFEQQQVQQQQQQQGVAFLRNAARQRKQQQGHKRAAAPKQTKSVLQRDADLLPLAHAAQHSAEGRAVVDSWECLRGMVQAWEGRCGQLDQYGMKQTRLFANLCNAGVQPHALAQVLPGVPCAAA